MVLVSYDVAQDSNGSVLKLNWRKQLNQNMIVRGIIFNE